MKLADLLRDVPVEAIEGDAEIEIAEVRDDSRRVGAGDLFVAQAGLTVDGHGFLGAAADKGAVAAVVERPVGRETFPGTRVRVSSSARALGRIAANRHGRPAEALTLVGITGTNGKTTTSFLAESLVRQGGGTPGVIGTVTYRHGGVARPAPFTTPTPLELHATLAEMRDAGCTHLVAEVSSHALALDRLEGVDFTVAAFTNLTQDHLDLHGSMEAYRDAKARLFAERLRPDGTAVVHADAEAGPFMMARARGRVLAVSARPEGKADLRPRRVGFGIGGIEAELETPVGPVVFRSPLIGAYNLENLVVAAGIGVALGLSAEAIGAGLAALSGVPGRVERVREAEAHGFALFVDYAHTPDALERVMAALRPLVTGRLIVVFGCGGDRDKTKRPKMGQAVARDADLAVVTSDNPRTEPPAAIIEMILDGVRREASPALDAAGLATAGRGFIAEVDRRKAIALAVAAARPGDAVLVAGKGHEDYQILGTVKHPFDDREEARRAIEKLASAARTQQS